MGCPGWMPYIDCHVDSVPHLRLQYPLYTVPTVPCPLIVRTVQVATAALICLLLLSSYSTVLYSTYCTRLLVLVGRGASNASSH